MNNNKREYKIIVSEPWNFESPDGKNIIIGTILSIINSHLLVFKANHLLNFDRMNGDILILSPRFKDTNFDSIVIQEIEVNAGLFVNDYNGEMEASKLKDISNFVLIGTLCSKK